MIKIIFNNFRKVLIPCVVFLIIIGWIFSSWPQIWNNPPIPPEIQEAQAAHTFNTNLRFTGATSPLTSNYTAGAGATVLVLGIVTAGTTLRAGGTPTFNGVNLTQADQTRGGGTGYETSVELWYLIGPPTGSAYSISVPNTGSRTLYVQASTYIAQAGYTSALDVANGKAATTGANPSVSVTTNVDGDTIVGVLGDGVSSAPTAQTGTNLNRTDDGSYSDNNQYYLQSAHGAYAMGWTVATDDNALVVAAFKEVVINNAPNAPTLSDVPLDNEKTGDSTPAFQFTADDPDGTAGITYQIQVDDDYAFGSMLINCESDTSCTTGAGSFTRSGDSDPFTEGEEVTFTPTTAMTNTATYYWRVRAEDNAGEGGSGNYGDWSDIHSVTYIEGADPSDWFQTTDEQFLTGTRDGTAVSGSDQVVLGSAIEATGGTITESSGYKYHTFTSSGTFEVTVGSGNVEVLVVAGGAAGGTGGTAGRGGGGAGGIVYNASYSVTVGSYTTTVGGGGAPGTSSTTSGSGNNSVFDTITALGGGGAGPHATAGTAGGSGGGGSGYLGEAGGAGNQPGSASGGYGNTGGAAYNGGVAPGLQGGGGGAGAVGVSGTSSSAGSGGVGLEYSQFSGVGGSPAGWFGGGGGGGATSGSTAGSGGQGGGGAGSSSGVGTSGTANTGGGGGGATSTGGSGGSGIVIVRYSTSGSSSGTIMSPEIDYDWVAEQLTWGTAAFSTTETNGDIKLKVYYTVSTACDTIVPNGVLSGNSSGFDVSASPISLAGLTPVASTYNKICLQATLTDSGGTPYLNDWTVTWASAAVYSVSVDPTSVDYGGMAMNTTKASATITATVGNSDTKLNITGADATYTSYTWTLSAALGEDQYVHAFTKNTGLSSGGTLGSDAASEWVALDKTGNQVLAATVLANGSQDFKLDMRTPSTAGVETDLGSQYSTDVTIVASAP